MSGRTGNGMNFRELLARDGKLVYTNRGDSMQPLIREGRDLIVVERIRQQPKRYDVILYQRDNGEYVLHRILRKRGDGYVLCGDHQWRPEYGIREDQILGILTAVIREGKEVPMGSLPARLYAHVWCDGFYPRAAALRVRGLIRGIRRRLRKGRGRQA